jgi:hypothetical protein
VDLNPTPNLKREEEFPLHRSRHLKSTYFHDRLTQRKFDISGRYIHRISSRRLVCCLREMQGTNIDMGFSTVSKYLWSCSYNSYNPNVNIRVTVPQIITVYLPKHTRTRAVQCQVRSKVFFKLFCTIYFWLPEQMSNPYYRFAPFLPYNWRSICLRTTFNISFSQRNQYGSTCCMPLSHATVKSTRLHTSDACHKSETLKPDS